MKFKIINICILKIIIKIGVSYILKENGFKIECKKGFGFSKIKILLNDKKIK